MNPDEKTANENPPPPAGGHPDPPPAPPMKSIAGCIQARTEQLERMRVAAYSKVMEAYTALLHTNLPACRQHIVDAMKILEAK